ncbi:MAG: glycosyltransferase family 2 protein, partial [Actinomycetota bacterium]|nr:glycosyltransferase family 2 protein [Actinomycetota bacterium]
FVVGRYDGEECAGPRRHQRALLSRRLMTGASLSVVVVAHDSLPELRRSLPALAGQLTDGDELILVDNASGDGLAAELEQLAPNARLIELSQNVGFAGGVNRGAEQAGGDLLVLLNPDALVGRGWAEAIRAPWGGPWAAWMGLVLLDGGVEINTSGGVLHFLGFGWAGQVGQPAAAASRGPAEVGFLSGACLAIPVSAWRQAGGFAEHFFMYCEDVDLSLRLRLRGGRLAVIPDARVQHSYEFVKGPRKWRLLERNRWATLVRTYPAPLLIAVLPALFGAELAVWAVALRGGWARMKLLATLDVLTSLPGLRRERRELQRGRHVASHVIADGMTARLDSPYFGSVGSNRLVRWLLDAYWAAVRAVLP